MDQLNELKQKILQLIGFHHECYSDVIIEFKDNRIGIKYTHRSTQDSVETQTQHSGFIAYNPELGEGELVFYDEAGFHYEGSKLVED